MKNRLYDEKGENMEVSFPVPTPTCEEILDRQERVIRSYRRIIWVLGFGFFAMSLTASILTLLLVFSAPKFHEGQILRVKKTGEIVTVGRVFHSGMYGCDVDRWWGDGGYGGEVWFKDSELEPFAQVLSELGPERWGFILCIVRQVAAGADCGHDPSHVIEEPEN